MFSSITAKLIAAGVIAAAVIGVLWYAVNLGKDVQLGKDQKATTQTQERIDNADAHGARSSGDVDKRLRDGSF